MFSAELCCAPFAMVLCFRKLSKCAVTPGELASATFLLDPHSLVSSTMPGCASSGLGVPGRTVVP